MNKVLSGLSLCLMTAMAVVGFAEEKEFKATCPVLGKEAKKEFSADYKGAKVYFCCEKCQAAFGKDQATYTVKANAQLVQTGQAKQTKCPFSGHALNPDIKVKVGETDVGFCCNSCKNSVSKLKGDDQMAAVFADKPFQKGFEVNKK